MSVILERQGCAAVCSLVGLCSTAKRGMMPEWQHHCHAPPHSKTVLLQCDGSCVKSIGISERLNDNSFLIIFTLSNITSIAIRSGNTGFLLPCKQFRGYIGTAGCQAGDGGEAEIHSKAVGQKPARGRYTVALPVDAVVAPCAPHDVFNFS
ncbi:MAG: hypothetical protein EOO80_06400 [Oxalobacteraceae bacterium]|nr:MAG: hypothetical protein EOO80_06400 [Oxalobacteraceae bacterium]